MHVRDFLWPSQLTFCWLPTQMNGIRGSLDLAYFIWQNASNSDHIKRHFRATLRKMYSLFSRHFFCNDCVWGKCFLGQVCIMPSCYTCVVWPLRQNWLPSLFLRVWSTCIIWSGFVTLGWIRFIYHCSSFGAQCFFNRWEFSFSLQTLRTESVNQLSL